ncbi:hypothetical protein [Mangrovimonas sp. DI 80]|uniref:hypothetical protein n=1 Tax=Mangrovimonas sp. DI 80 TaxID=1779330 RepID=UPI0015C54D48|nr:hypothetical protein [Mangrovimonas sp. DI 80]
MAQLSCAMSCLVAVKVCGASSFFAPYLAASAARCPTAELAIAGTLIFRIKLQYQPKG